MVKRLKEPLSVGKINASINANTRQVEAKERGIKWPTTPIPQGEPNAYFLCYECGQTHLNSELGFSEGHNNTNKVCKSCAVLPPKKARTASENKRTAKRYKTGRNLPSWMFS